LQADLPALFGAVYYMFSAYFVWFTPIAAFVNGAMMVRGFLGQRRTWHALA